MTESGEPEAYKDDTLRSIGISPRERLQRIEEMLSAMDSKLDAKFDHLEKRVWALEINVPTAARMQADLAKHDTEIQGMRRWMWMAMGVIALLTFMVPIATSKGWI